MNLQTNPQLDLAYQYVCNTNKHLFLTGKAGSGKTTFLHKLRKARVKRMAIVAPTGVAAINAGGVTIHSLFQIAIGLHLPGVARQNPQGRFRAEKMRLIRGLDLLVIDEVSMVRADLLDAMDEVLKRLRSSSQPFGGVQLLMIGDLHQLPPVVKPEDWELLRQHYETPYFFGSHALRKTDYIAIELKHIYRQADPEFIALLNQVRDGRLDEQSLEKLNSRYVPNFLPPPDLPYITLTATNAAAAEINTASLNRLPGKKLLFPAIITGDFPSGSFPTEANLELKIGAQVMFIRNDTSDQRLFFNGKIGTIKQILNEYISIRCPGENHDILVEPSEWQNITYSFNEQTKAIEEQVVGTFTQFPLRHAWAITIHKSQGLTFERCIIDAQAAFASGQVYVALSRCKSFEGIVLRSRIIFNSVKTDPVVKDYSAQAERNAPTEAQLRTAKYECQARALQALFRFEELNDMSRDFLKFCQHYAKSITNDVESSFGYLQQAIQSQLYDVGEKFAPQLAMYLQADELPEENEVLQTRLRKASAYFVDKLSDILQQLEQITLETDHKEVSQIYDNSLEIFTKAIIIKKVCFSACSDGFSAERVHRAKVDAELEKPKTAINRPRRHSIPQDILHPTLYARLADWRYDTAIRKNMPELDIAPNLTLKELATFLPRTKKQLSHIRGIGKARLQKYGDEWLKLISAYCEEHALDAAAITDSLQTAATMPQKSQTKRISLEMFQSGKTPEEIATARGLAISTIENHLLHFIERGDLDICLFLDEPTLGDIMRYLNNHPDSTLAITKEHFGDQYSYRQIRMAYTVWRRLLN